jgi:hypothetical protein
MKNRIIPVFSAKIQTGKDHNLIFEEKEVDNEQI